MGIVGALATVADLIPVIERGTTALLDAWQRYQAARDTLSETDRATLDQQYDQTKLKAQMDAMRLITELIWAESQPPAT